MKLLLVVLAACGSSEPPVDCTTISTGVKRYWADRAEQTTEPDERAAIVETTRAAADKLEHHCVADQWNQDMIACTRVVFRLEDSGCMKYLSRLQLQKWQGGEEPPVRGGIGVGP